MNAACLQLYEGPAPGEIKKKTEDRRDNELRIGNDNYVMPSELIGDTVAMSEWCRITDLYKDAGLRITSNSDVNILARYCLLHSEQLELRSEHGEMPDVGERVRGKMGEKVIRTQEYMQWEAVEKRIRNNMVMLLKLEDRLFLNPLAKFKNIPMIVKRDEKKEELETLGFGDV